MKQQNKFTTATQYTELQKYNDDKHLVQQRTQSA